MGEIAELQQNTANQRTTLVQTATLERKLSHHQDEGHRNPPKEVRRPGQRPPHMEDTAGGPAPEQRRPSGVRQCAQLCMNGALVIVAQTLTMSGTLRSTVLPVRHPPHN